MESWQDLLNCWVFQRLSDRVIFAIGTWLVHIGVFWTFNLFLLLCRKNKWYETLRIDKQATPSDELMSTCISGLLKEHFLLQPILLYLVYPYFQSFGMEVRSPLPSGKTVLRDFLISAICNDLLFYVAHRVLHFGAFYKHIHKKHHEFKATVGIASEYANPVEALFANLIPTLIGPFLLGSHVVVLWIWLGYRVYETIDTHSGYLFQWSISELLPFTGGRERHYFHHSHNIGCFGAYYLDWLFGTDKAFLEYKRKKAENEKKSL
jgi:methylsterol monooxygenase